MPQEPQERKPTAQEIWTAIGLLMMLIGVAMTILGFILALVW